MIAGVGVVFMVGFIVCNGSASRGHCCRGHCCRGLPSRSGSVATPRRGFSMGIDAVAVVLLTGITVANDMTRRQFGSSVLVSMTVFEVAVC